MSYGVRRIHRIEFVQVDSDEWYYRYREGNITRGTCNFYKELSKCVEAFMDANKGAIWKGADVDIDPFIRDRTKFFKPDNSETEKKVREMLAI